MSIQKDKRERPAKSSAQKPTKRKGRTDMLLPQLILLNNATVHADASPDILTGGGKGKRQLDLPSSK
jgi:hypothetical protein